MTTMDARTLRAVMDTVIDGLITIDEQGTIRSFNPAAVKIFGYQPEEVIGQNVQMLIPEPNHAEQGDYLENFRKVIGTGREVAARRKDGSAFPIDLGVNEMMVGEEQMYVGLIRDITERKQQEANKIFLATLTDSLPDGLITFDEQGTLLSINPAAQRMFGYPPDELLGRNVKMLMADVSHPEHDGYVESFVATDPSKAAGTSTREVVARRKNGSTFPMDLSINQMWIHKIRVFAGLLRDSSERKELERKNQQYIDDLARSNHELDDFAHIASHDLKEPLRGVTNNATFLKEDYGEQLDDKAAKRLERMVFLCQRMERLVDDLLYFSRLGRQQLAIQPTDLNEVVKDIQSLLETTLHEQHAEVAVPRPLPTIVCDLPRITEAFRNLITNALKYNDSDPKCVEIGYVAGPELGPDIRDPLVFFVRDNGMGIAKEFHREVFRIFKRLNEEDDTRRGSGVGLTFVQKIIERHRGRIWLESEVGKGTTFYFTINSAAEEAK